MRNILLLLLGSLSFIFSIAQAKPNVVFIYADDLGYGDLSCYGATRIATPNIDRLAKQGVRFTNAHSTSATCTPSRYALMTGCYPWRKKGTDILPGDAALIVPTNKITLPRLFKNVGYKTAIIGKWHLGLGNAVEKNWNKELKPGPNEVGFDYSFIFPATADRVPTVFLENHSVIGLDSTDPIEVSYERPVGNDPLGKDNPQLLKMQSDPDHEHDKTIVNGIARIGYMRGGKRARWTDEEMPLTFLQKAKDFIEDNRRRPFFLYYSLTEPHVPRMPSTMFKNKSGLGYRGDVILQLDWAVGEIMKELEQLGIEKNTIIVFSSDNGPVLDDGYQDEAITRLNGHTPGGPLRGGKYSAFEAGTRVPLILRWPSVVQAKVSDALLSQIDFLASFAHLLQTSFPATEAADSYNMLDAFLGKTSKGRDWLIEQNAKNTLSIIKDNWKFIEPNPGTSFFSSKRIELGNNSAPQLYHLTRDIREQNNLAEQGREKVDELKVLLQKIKSGSTKEL